MAGYIISFSKDAGPWQSMEEGCYATLSEQEWRRTTDRTLADYVGVKEGDTLFFFSDRMIYGIGEVVKLYDDCKTAALELFPGASFFEKTDRDIIMASSLCRDPLVTVKKKGGSKECVKRWGILFKPSPHLFRAGVDMDVLLAGSSNPFHSLKMFSGRSFMKLEPEEVEEIKKYLLQKNVAAIQNPEPGTNTIKCNYQETIDDYNTKRAGRDCSIDIPGLFRRIKNSGKSPREAILEAVVVYQLTIEDESATRFFGKQDYISRQVQASPLKANDGWIDKMDIFCFQNIPGYSYPGSFLIIELKRDMVVGENIAQVTRYADWVAYEYAGGDYSLVSAVVLAPKVDVQSVSEHRADGERHYITGSHPKIEALWSGISFYECEVNNEGHVDYRYIKIE